MILSKEDARNFLVNYHNLNTSNNLKGKEGILELFNRINSIQYDPLDVVGRNADLVLQSRVDEYKTTLLHELLYKDNELIDGFDKEMCIYRTREFNRFKRIRESRGESIKETLSHRGQLEALNILDEVREHIKNNGVTATKDISIGESKKSSWGHKKLSSAALDYLYSIGELSVKEKKGINKYFDYTEKVIGKIELEEDFKEDEEFLEWYIKRRIQSVGLLWDKRGGAWQGYYLSDSKLRKETLSNLCDKGILLRFNIEGIKEPFYMNKENERFLNVKSKKKEVKFLAPLDNILWDRDMVSKIFDFDYRWEVYTPVVKRKYGYYVLPVLYGNKFIARFEPEKINKNTPLTIKNWWWEENIDITDELLKEIHLAIKRFSDYLEVTSYDSYLDIIMK